MSTFDSRAAAFAFASRQKWSRALPELHLARSIL